MNPELSKFLRHLEEVIEIDTGKLTGDEKVSELPNWDSVSILTFMAMMDSEYDVLVPPQKILESETVLDLSKLILT